MKYNDNEYVIFEKWIKSVLHFYNYSDENIYSRIEKKFEIMAKKGLEIL